MFVKINPQVAAGETERRRKLRKTYEPRMVVERHENNTATLVDIHNGKLDPVPVHLSRVKFHKHCIPEIYLAQEELAETRHLEAIPEEEEEEGDSDNDLEANGPVTRARTSSRTATTE